MSEINAKQRLRSLAPNQILPNPENPRLVFRQEEMESLMLSIDKHGIQVPITVYEEGGIYRLIDGERRWRCATKLNHKTIPALIQRKPSELENLVLMYNIHALREQWDYFTIASKLERVIALVKKEQGVAPSEATLSELTGLTRGAIRRCQLLLGLPDRFKQMLLVELEKPKAQQRLSEDFFIEMERSLKTVVNRIPEYSDRIDSIRDTLVEKFRRGTIAAVTDFRQLAKIATAVKKLGLSARAARKALDKVFDRKNSTSIRDSYAATVEFMYDEQKAVRYVESLAEFIEEVGESDRRENLDEEFLAQLNELYRRLKRFLGK
jgi:ParB family chromosome partitioning protein